MGARDTNLPLPKNELYYYDEVACVYKPLIGEGGIVSVKLALSDIMLPVDLQGRLSQTIQSHNAVSIGANGNSATSAWIDCAGFDKLAITLLNDSPTATSVVSVRWSHDNSTFQGYDSSVIVSGTGLYRAGVTEVKARYAKLDIGNGDAGSAHTMSAWIYLKA